MPPSYHFEKLHGNPAGRCSIRVNDQWRLTSAGTAAAAKQLASISTTMATDEVSDAGDEAPPIALVASV
jgi:hypothetical protein